MKFVQVTEKERFTKERFFYKNHAENEAGRLIPDLQKSYCLVSIYFESRLVSIYFDSPQFDIQ